MTRARHLADGVVDMRAERLSALVAIEQRREHFRRQRRRNKQRILPQRAQDHFAQLLRRRAALRKLHVVFRAGGLMPGGYAAVHPLRLFEQFPSLRYLLGSKYIRDRQ